MWKGSLTSSTRRSARPCSHAATAVMDVLVERPTGCAITDSSGTSRATRYRRPTIASLIVSPRPTPPVTTISGA
ncbi:MAG TPA: hypothetical protein VM094_02500 [Gemmatimonadales bacterium]|nr:hypothetical protein [Gemmatimonadales bacterium]